MEMRTAQELAGHSSPILTAHYSHPRVRDLAGAVEMLPRFLPDRPDQSEALRATGTGGKHALQHLVQHVGPGRISPHSDASTCIGEGMERVSRTCHNSLQEKTVGTSMHLPASPCIRVGDGTRTHDVQIHSLAL